MKLTHTRTHKSLRKTCDAFLCAFNTLDATERYEFGFKTIGSCGSSGKIFRRCVGAYTKRQVKPITLTATTIGRLEFMFTFLFSTLYALFFLFFCCHEIVFGIEMALFGCRQCRCIDSRVVGIRCLPIFRFLNLFAVKLPHTHAHPIAVALVPLIRSQFSLSA